MQQDTEWKWFSKTIKHNDILTLKESNTLDYKEQIYLYEDKRIKKQSNHSSHNSTTLNFENAKDYFIGRTEKIDLKKLAYTLTKYLLAFLNTNGGALVFGVTDGDTKVIGLSHWCKLQEDAIKLALDNAIRSFSITPRPICNVDYKFDFLPLQMGYEIKSEDEQRYLLILEVKKSNDFHYCIIGGKLRSWERLNVSLIDLALDGHELVKRITKQREKKTEPKQESKYFTLVFADQEVLVNDDVLRRQKNSFNARIYRFERWCELGKISIKGKINKLDDCGRFRVDRPSKYFLMVYQYLQIGIISIPLVDYAVFLMEADFYQVQISKHRVFSNGFVTIIDDSREAEFEKIKSEIHI